MWSSAAAAAPAAGCGSVYSRGPRAPLAEAPRLIPGKVTLEDARQDERRRPRNGPRNGPRFLRRAAALQRGGWGAGGGGREQAREENPDQAFNSIRSLESLKCIPPASHILQLE